MATTKKLDLDNATITSLAPRIQKKEISPVELTEATLERVAKLQPKLLPFVTVTADYARQRAKVAEQEIVKGRYRGPFHGIPYTLKDWVDAKGVRTTYSGPGGPVQEYIPTVSCTIHDLLEGAGGILIGKVDPGINLGAGGDGPVGCRNAWDPSRSPGTSSAGSGSATAASMGLGSIGADTGGSVRHPASNSNLVGMRPTLGRISGFGCKASPLTLDQCGPITKTVEDNAIMMNILGAYDPRDPASINEPNYDHLQGLKNGIKGMRIAVPMDDWVWKDWLSEEEEQVVRKAIAVLGEMGAIVTDVKMPLSGEGRELMQFAGGGGNLFYLDKFKKDQVAKLWPQIWADWEASLSQPVGNMLKGQLRVAKMRQEVAEVLTKHDVIALPTGSTYGDAWNDKEVNVRGRMVPARSRAVWRNGMASVCGHPSMSVPAGFGNKDRWPIGLMLQGPKLSEPLLYRVAYAYEQATSWHKRHPKLDNLLDAVPGRADAPSNRADVAGIRAGDGRR